MTGKNDPRVTKQKVTMTSVFAVMDGNGIVEVQQQQAIDYVRPDILDAYVTDAKTRWQSVIVTDEKDAGPGGYDGQTHIPASLDHPLAGTTDPATGA